MIIVFFPINQQICSAQNSYWNQFRGPNGSGIASETSNPPIEFSENSNLEWKIEIPEGSSSPAIWEDRIYITGYLEDSQELQTICIDRNDGNIIWENILTPDTIELYHTVSNPAPATIAVDESGVFVYFASYGIRCFSHQGELKWGMEIPSNGMSVYGDPSSPIIVDEKLILLCDYGDAEKRSLMALNKNNGDTIWNSLIQITTPFFNLFNTASYSTPIHYQDQIVLHRCGGISSYSVEDGSPIWWFPATTNGTSTPIIFNNRLIVGMWNFLSESARRGEYLQYDSFEKVIADYDTNQDSLLDKSEMPDDLLIFSRPDLDLAEVAMVDKRVSARSMFDTMLDMDHDGFINKQEWVMVRNVSMPLIQDFGTVMLPLDMKGAISFNDAIWDQLNRTPEVPSPVVYENLVYLIETGGWLSIIDANTGEVYFQDRIDAKGAYMASPIAANGNIYLASYNGEITVLKSGKTPETVNRTRLNGKILATPAIAGNNIYIRTSDYLYSFAQ